MMTKPKFTPDPPPYLQGLSVEQAFPLFVDWMIRQNYRQEDWWPKDYEERIQTLERLSPYCIGEWTIADAAYINFGDIQVEQVYIPKGYMYGLVGTQAFETESDYLNFNPTPVAVTGLNFQFVEMFDNRIGQAITYKSGNANNPFYFSTDGLVWTPSNPQDMFGTGGAVWFNDRWVCVGSEDSSGFGYGLTCSETTDGSSWTTLYTTASRDLEYLGVPALATDGTKILMSAYKGSSPASSRIGVSTDGGSTWSSYVSPNATEFSAGIWYAGGLWFYGTRRRYLYMSPSGLDGTWTLVLSLGILNSEFVSVEYGNGVWMAATNDESAGTPDVLYRSTDGTNWSTSITVAPANSPAVLNYSETNGWLYANDTIAKYSTDNGLTWNNTNLGATISSQVRGFMDMNITP